MAQKTLNAAFGGGRSGAGTFLHRLPGLRFAFHFHANGMAKELPIDQAMPDHRDGWLWLHFDLAEPHAAESVQSIDGLPAPAKMLLTTANNQQQLYADDSCTYGVFAVFIDGQNEDAMDIGFVQFAVTKAYFVSSCFSRLSAIESFRDVVRSGKNIPSVAALVEAIFKRVVDSVDDYAKTLAENLDDIEEMILVDKASDQRDALGRIRRATIRLSRQITNSRLLIHRFEYENSRHKKSPIRFATERLGQRLDWLNTAIAAVRERAHVLQEEAMLRTADQTNRHLQVLSIVATVFLPATLIAGIFGMNVKGLPLTENSNGFLWSMAILIGAAGLVYWLLRRSGILER